VDVLSEVLRVVRLSGAIHFRGEFTRPWAFSSSPPEMLAARLKLPEGSVTPFHVCVEGICVVTSGKLPPIHIETGDVIIFPRGDQHVMASDPGIAPVPIKDIYSKPSTNEITVLRYGGDGPLARFICGYDSEAAFNRAFHRIVGSPPATWRQAKDSSRHASTGSNEL
jgi:AraC family transcriptional regulator, alkane utilization regulator